MSWSVTIHHQSFDCMHIGEVGRFQNFRTSVTLTLAWDRVTQHTVVYHSLIDLYTIKFVEMGMTFLYVRADTKTGFLGRRAGDDVKDRHNGYYFITQS